MRVLIACEFSGIVREAFRNRGHDAWSCDLLPAEDGSRHHIQADINWVLHISGWCVGLCFHGGTGIIGYRHGARTNAGRDPAYGNHEAATVLYALTLAICHGKEATSRLADVTINSMSKTLKTSSPEWN